MAIKMTAEQKINFARDWNNATKLDAGKGLDYLVDRWHLSKQDCSTVATGLRKALKRDFGVVLPEMPKSGRASSTSKETLADIAEMLTAENS